MASRTWCAPMCGKAFAARSTSPSGRPSALPDLADGAAGAVRVDHRHARAAILAVPGQDHVVHVLAPRRLHVDVDVGKLVAHRVHEPLERQVVADGVDVGDAGQVADERPGRRAAARAPDPHGSDVGHDVGDRQEVRRVAHRLDHRELVVEPVADLAGWLRAAFLHPPPAPFGEHRPGAAAGRHGELGEVDAADPQIELAPLGDPQRRVAQVRALGEQHPHLPRRLQPSLVVAASDVVLGERNDLAHALERVGQERVLRHQVPHGVRGHAGQPDMVEEPYQPPDLVRRSGLPVVADLDEQVPAVPAAAEGLPPRPERRSRGVVPAGHGQCAGLGLRSQQAHQSLGALAHLAGGERRVAPLAAHVRAR